MLNNASTDKESTVIDFNEPIDLINFAEQIVPLVSEYMEATI